jgi:hypothetical protein
VGNYTQGIELLAARVAIVTLGDGENGSIAFERFLHGS